MRFRQIVQVVPGFIVFILNLCSCIFVLGVSRSLAVDISEIDYQGRPHYLVRTASGVWYYDRAGGGFSRWIDRDGRDWIGFSKEPLSEYPESAAAGYRGIPNAVFVGPDKGAGHPGFDRCRSSVLGENAIQTKSLSGNWQWTWTFDEHSATFQMELADADHPWWFLYEGTIAGSFEPKQKRWATEAGEIHSEVPDNRSQHFDTWQTLYLADQRVPRTLVIHQHETDRLKDTYWYLGSSDGGAADSEDGMVVVGFGRGPGTQPLLRGSGIRFTIGLVEKTLGPELLELSIPELFAASREDPSIEFWYGGEQSFGKFGLTQRWVNLLGSISPAGHIEAAQYRLDGGKWHSLSWGTDLHRLARPGDFNVELDSADLSAGTHELEVSVTWEDGQQHRQKTVFTMHPNPETGSTWPLPYSLDFSKPRFQGKGMVAVHEVVQIIDGKWGLESDGLRTLEPWYDRVIGVGSQWTDFDARVRLTIHDFLPPQNGPPTYDVTHCGIALRWPGHWPDGRQPSRRWYPMGCQGELLLRRPADACRWRALPGVDSNSRPVVAEETSTVPLGRPIYIRAQVETLDNGDSCYRFKHWDAADEEPVGWAVTQTEAGSTDIRSGSLLVVPHNSDVTLHSIEVGELAPQ